MSAKESIVNFDLRNESSDLTVQMNGAASHFVESTSDTFEQTRVTALQKEKIVVKQKPVYDLLKRAFDIIVALLCLTVGLPVYLIIILAIVIDDPGNPFFIQERIGLNGRAFHMIKLRTMYSDADRHKSELMGENEYDCVHFKMKNDPRVTKVGYFLRATSLDEISQAVNLLTGTMSVIGPRPFVPSEQAQLPDDRLCVKPGLSCYWQITDTTKMSYDEQLELDYKYIRERGIWTDVKIILKTIKHVFNSENC